MRIGRIWWIAGAIACGVTSISQGAILTFGFEGDVTNIHDPVGVLDFVEPGQRFVYTFSFDTDTPNIYPEPNPNAGSYMGIPGSLTVGGFPFTTGDTFINIANSPGSDTFEVASSIQWDRPELLPSGHGVSVDLVWGNAFDSPALPQASYELCLFTYKWFQVLFQIPGGSTGEALYITGEIHSMYLVPEPTTAILLALSGIKVAGKRRRC